MTTWLSRSLSDFLSFAPANAQRHRDSSRKTSSLDRMSNSDANSIRSDVLARHREPARANRVERGFGLSRKMIRLGIAGKISGFDFGLELFHRAADRPCGIAELADELCRRREAQVDEVVQHQHLPLAFRSRAHAHG